MRFAAVLLVILGCNAREQLHGTDESSSSGANSDHVSGCESSGCCTPFCNMDAPDDCAAQLPRSACRTWFEPGEFPNTCPQ